MALTWLIVLIALAVVFLLLGTLRGSYRLWLVGYALTAAALVASFSAARAPSARDTPPASQQPARAPAGAVR